MQSAVTAVAPLGSVAEQADRYWVVKAERAAVSQSALCGSGSFSTRGW